MGKFLWVFGAVVVTAVLVFIFKEDIINQWGAFTAPWSGGENSTGAS